MSQLPDMVMVGRGEVTRSPSPIITPVDDPPQQYSTQAMVRESLVVSFSDVKHCFVNCYGKKYRF